MLGLAQQAGHELTQDAADADVLVVNTCAFIDSAKQESIDTILEMAQHKKDGACRRLIVTGCLAERYRDELRRRSRRSTRCSAPARCPRSSRASRRAPTSADVLPSTPPTEAREHPGRPSTCRPQHPATSTLPDYIYDADTPRLMATPSTTPT
jgi:ribosomal protein S12 methylthiotransferase